jgi:hypothetical protein
MDDQNLPIGGFLHIELDEVGVLLGRKTKCGQCILRRDRRRTSVRNDQRGNCSRFARNANKPTPTAASSASAAIPQQREGKSSWAE